MGLDFSHCDARWAYSGFMRFRLKLASEIEIALHCMESFAWNHSEDKPYENVLISGYREEDKITDFRPTVGIQPVIKWSTVNDDIVPLLNHSDCDGILTPEECQKVAPRLRVLIKDWDDDDRDKIHGLLLAEGMEKAAELNENLEFS